MHHRKLLALTGARRLIKPVVFVVAMLLAKLPDAMAQSSTGKVVQAADKFLATLSADQRKKVVYAFDDREQRSRWSNFPTGMVPRGGISLKDMTAPQRAAVMDLLAAVLSPMGYQKVDQIRLADDDFKSNGSKKGPRNGGPPGGGPPGGGPPGGGPPGGGPPGGGPPGDGPPGGPGGPPPQLGAGNGPKGRPPFGGGDMFGRDLYYISFLGNPSPNSPWLLQFGGHHLALNITVAGNKRVMTPSLTGAQPATFQLNGQTIRPIGRESDKALALLQSLDDKQRKQAVLDYRVADLILGPGQDGKKVAPEGLKASVLNDKQQTMLLDLISEWAGIMNESAASAHMAELKADLNETWFAWSGPTTSQPGTNIAAYYRIQGPHLVIEYAPQHDEPTNHVHTIYRDPTNDYGQQFSAR